MVVFTGIKVIFKYINISAWYISIVLLDNSGVTISPSKRHDEKSQPLPIKVLKAQIYTYKGKKTPQRSTTSLKFMGNFTLRLAIHFFKPRKCGEACFVLHRGGGGGREQDQSTTSALPPCLPCLSLCWVFFCSVRAPEFGTTRHCH